MRLSRLQIRNIRNIEYSSVDLGPKVNLFAGENGSGKTSILESVHFLSSGRSFRSGKENTLLKKGADGCLVRGLSETGQEMSAYRDKVKGRRMTLGSRILDRASELAQRLPVLVLAPQTINLLIGGPEYRRRFLNWGVFHVEPAFRQVWEDGNRCLYQRNQLLKKEAAPRRDLESWSSEFVRLSETIHRYRAKYMSEFQESFQESISITGLTDVEVTYQPGWNSDSSLAEQLASVQSLDLKRGFTSKGFHRADLAVTRAKREASSFCSRGELKRLAWGMLLKQGEGLNGEVIYLVDDLTSELDRDSRERVCKYLVEKGNQILATAVDQAELASCWGANTKTMFHVEHGVIKRESL